MKSGFISIIGRPNVGKSTLLNGILGEKIAIATSKPQTTRNTIRGIYTTGDCQMVFIDTPGIHKPKTKLGNFMTDSALNTFKEVDLVLFLVDDSLSQGPGDKYIVEMLKNINTPKFLVINKMDKINPEDYEKIYNEYGKRFPLLIKYLDVNDRLSIQVHPDDEVANKKHNELGKSESWYIMEASDDAVLIMGMKPGITKEVFLEKAKNNDFSGMFEEISVKKGDLVDITPGMVHASLTGSVLFAEIQENSDVTYRIYDFDRIENGKKRELHIDDAAEVIDFEKKADVRKTEFENGETRKNIIKKKYYNIDKVKVEEKFEDINEESMIIYSILEGKGSIESSNSTLDIQKGEFWYLLI